METENQWNQQPLFFFFSPVHVLGSEIVSNVDVKRSHLIKRTLGKLQGDPGPPFHSQRVTEMLFTRARGLQAD